MSNGKITVVLVINRMIIGGAEQQFLELVKGLDKKRFNVIAVTLFSGGDLEPEIKKVPDIEYICLNRKGKYDFSSLFDIYSLIRKKRVDVIQPFLTPVTFFVLLPAIIGRVPVRLVTERGNQRTNPGRGYLFYLRLEDFLSRFADWVIPNSYSGKDYLIKRGHNPSRIQVIYNGINSQRLQPDPGKVIEIRRNMGLPENGTVIGISASLIPLKDHATFLKAAQLVHNVIPQAKFAILGDGPLKSSLTELAGNLGISPYVIFLGNQVDVSEYLSAFDILCLSSAQPEGCSNAILEAMVLGKPVVATDTGGNKELVQDNHTGLLVPVKDPQAMADAIVSCIMKPEWAAQMGQRGKELVKTRFSLELMIKNYETLYEDTLRHKNVRKKLN